MESNRDTVVTIIVHRGDTYSRVYSADCGLTVSEMVGDLYTLAGSPMACDVAIDR